MQLLAIAIYSINGAQRVLRFKPGELNVVTGVSATGKSALLDIVEYCLGRSTITLPVGPVTQTASWYACLFEMEGTSRAFVARPAPRPGLASTERAMLEFGAGIGPLPFESLRVNADADSVRLELGRLMGFEENRTAGRQGAIRPGLEAHLGHAALLCLQGQGEIANRTLLFHRQGEAGIADAIRDTLPYFLGAVPRDQALKRQQLEAAERDLKRAETELANAQRAAQVVSSDVQAMVAEAYSAGLIGDSAYPDTRSAIAALRASLASAAPDAHLDDAQITRLRALETERSELRRQLRELGELRTLLVEEATDERDYQAAVSSERDRLQSIELVARPGENGEATTCPVCGSALTEPDPSVDDLYRSLSEVGQHLGDIEAGRPRRQAALADLDQRVDTIRQRLRALEAALLAQSQTDRGVDDRRSRPEARAFVQGRIDASLRRLDAADPQAVSRLQQRVDQLSLAAENLRATLDPEEEREQLTSRLLVIGADMTTWADRLQLEHSGRAIRLDARRLTVLVDTDSGPAPLFRIGSAENWIGYHLVAHLAMHRYFVRQNRPVPHFLMLDQPTQAYYPSEVEQRQGIPRGDADRAAVGRFYELMRDVTLELAPDFQVIVCDHANLAEDWFQRSIVENWRDGRKLIPPDWLRGAHA